MDPYFTQLCLAEIKELYPKSVLFNFLLRGISFFSKRLVTIREEESISEFRYVMD